MDLPLIDACLNATSTVLLLCGLVAIKRGARKVHERFMYAAFAASLAFLACYSTYHFVLDHPDVKYAGEGGVRTFYLVMLATHVVLAIVNVPLCVLTFVNAKRGERTGDFTRHKRWAKLTFPVWLYVSVTGVLVYLFLYVWNPALPAGAAR